MKRWIAAAIFVPVLISGRAVAAEGAPPGPLATLRAFHSLGNAEARNRLPVAFEAIVTFYRKYDHVLFVQDGDAAAYVQAPQGMALSAGDRILLRGTTRGSFRPYIVASEVTLLRHGAVPRPARATFDDLIRAKFDCQLVAVRGVVRSADQELASTASIRRMTLQILTEGGYIEASVDSDDASVLKSLLDAEVEIVGVNAGKFDGKMQQTGVALHVSSLADITILSRGLSTNSLPVTPMDEIIVGYHVRDLTRRVRVFGTITYDQPGSAVVLQSGDKSLWIMTRSLTPFRVGDLAYASGFPDVHDGSLTLTRSEIEDTQVRAPIMPDPTTWDQMTSRGNDLRDHGFDLVSIEGVVTTEQREASQDKYLLLSDGHLFSAIYRHPVETSQSQLAPMKLIPPGSKVRLSGICVVEVFNTFDNHVPFNILLGSASDIVVLVKPSLLTTRNLSYISGALVLVVMASGAWAWSLKKKVRWQTAALACRIEAEAALERQMAQVEQRRSRILEDINGSQSLTSILGQITDLVSFLLDGAPCWCEIRDEVLVGNHPPQALELRTVRLEIAAGSGPVLGSLVAGLSPETLPSPTELEALSAGARLATLAIENRRLYADLLHRSEHDLLTDIPNRFRLEQKLDQLMQGANRRESAFGLIYIDLDKFKQINDCYGHPTGDLYLQDVTRRMSLQLRSGDMLARIGGDEFIALVPILRSRADAEEIAIRLERCFDEPFDLDGVRLQGSASVGLAVYPEDGEGKEELQRSADAAMYAHKQSKRIEHILAAKR